MYVDVQEPCRETKEFDNIYIKQRANIEFQKSVGKSIFFVGLWRHVKF